MYTRTLEEKKQFALNRGYTLVSDKNMSKKDKVILVENSTGREFRSRWGSFRDGGTPTRTTLAQKKKDTLAKGYELLEDNEDFLTNSIARFRSIETGEVFETRYTDFHTKGYRGKQNAMPKGEASIYGYLTNNLVEEITFKYQYRITVNNRYLFFDFALLKNGEPVGFIEYNGLQHYSDKTFFGEKAHKRSVESDKLKELYAEQHSVPFLVIPYTVDKPQCIAKMVQDFFPTFTSDKIKPFKVIWKNACSTTLLEKKQIAKKRGYELLEKENFCHRDTVKLRSLDTKKTRMVRWQDFLYGVLSIEEFAVKRRKSSLADKKELARSYGYELLEDENFSVKKPVTLKEIQSGDITTIKWESFEKRYKKRVLAHSNKQA